MSLCGRPPELCLAGVQPLHVSPEAVDHHRLIALDQLLGRQPGCALRHPLWPSTRLCAPSSTHDRPRPSAGPPGRGCGCRRGQCSASTSSAPIARGHYGFGPPPGRYQDSNTASAGCFGSGATTGTAPRPRPDSGPPPASARRRPVGSMTRDNDQVEADPSEHVLRPLTSREEAVLVALITRGDHMNNDATVTDDDRARWLRHVPRTSAGRRCECETCPSIELTDPAGAAPDIRNGRVVLEPCASG